MTTIREEVWIPLIALGENQGRFLVGAQQHHNERLLNTLLAKRTVGVLLPSRETAEYYVRIFIQLRRAGAPIRSPALYLARCPAAHRLSIFHLTNINKHVIDIQYMPAAASSSATLPVAQTALRILIVANWLFGIGIFALLLVSPREQWVMAALGLSPSPDTERLIMGLRAVAVLGLIAIPLHYAVLSRLLAIVRTVREGDPFVATNARRLQTIAWALFALQLLSLAIGAIGRSVSSPSHPVHLDAGFSINGWLAVILTFLLARVFAEGTVMREDLEGTV